MPVKISAVAIVFFNIEKSSRGLAHLAAWRFNSLKKEKVSIYLGSRSDKPAVAQVRATYVAKPRSSATQTAIPPSTAPGVRRIKSIRHSSLASLTRT